MDSKEKNDELGFWELGIEVGDPLLDKTNRHLLYPNM